MNKSITDIFDESLQYKLSHSKDNVMNLYQQLIADFDKLSEAEACSRVEDIFQQLQSIENSFLKQQAQYIAVQESQKDHLEQSNQIKRQILQTDNNLQELKTQLSQEQKLRGFREECESISETVIKFKSQEQVRKEIQKCQEEILDLEKKSKAPEIVGKQRQLTILKQLIADFSQF